MSASRILLGSLAILIWVTPAAVGQTPADSAAIRQTVLDYVDGWWTGDTVRMERALHPALVKRSLFTLEATGQSMLNEIGKYDMVEYTRAGGGSAEPDEKGEVTVTIQNVHGEIANVVATSARFVDYLHLAKWNGRWVIVNVLWGSR